MIAESFATIVSLIGQYRAEKGAQTQLEYNDFMEWLTKTNHSEVKNLLELTTDATIYIKALLNQDHKIFKEKLDKIDAAVATFASTIEGFGSLAKVLNPNAVISEQAINILEQFQTSGASKILEIQMLSGPEYIFSDGDGSLEVKEKRFLEDDLQTLIEYGLLRHEYTSNGQNLYIFTRTASSLVNDRNS